MNFQPHAPGFIRTTLMLENYGTHKFPVVDPQAVDTNFHNQHNFNIQTAAAIEEINKKLEVLNWVAEHYPEILAQRETQRKWVQAMEGGLNCETSEK